MVALIAWMVMVFIMRRGQRLMFFLQEQRQITLLHQFLLAFIASGETPTRRTVTLEERCSFPFHWDKLCFLLPGWFPLHMHIRIPSGHIMLKEPGRVAQSVGHLTRKSGVLGSIPGLATYFRFSFRFFKKGSCQLLAKVCAQSTG